MNLNEAQEILKQAGYLCEFRDVSNPLDKRTKEDNYRDSEKSWNNMEGPSNFSREREKSEEQEAKYTNQLIAKVDEVCNRFEDYDYFVKRYDYRTIQVRTTDNGVIGGPFLQIHVNNGVNGINFDCVIGGVDKTQEKLRGVAYVSTENEEDVLKWVSTCLGKGYINESSNPAFDAAASLLAENYLLNEDYRDFLPDPDPAVEKAILSNMNADDSRSYGPDSAYDAAYKIVYESNPELDIPSDRSEYEEVYGYDPDDPPREVIDRIFG
jgi:hypothetical protein